MHIDERHLKMWQHRTKGTGQHKAKEDIYMSKGIYIYLLTHNSVLIQIRIL
jgi:hypothetical protein